MAEVLSREQPFWKVPLAEVCRPEREGRWVEAGGPGLCSIPGMGDRLRGTISTAPSFGDSLGEGGRCGAGRRGSDLIFTVCIWKNNGATRATKWG